MPGLDWFIQHFPDVHITDEQTACCRYLEQRGKRFCIDFGYENAPAMAWDEIDAEIELRRECRNRERWLD